jgi:putative CocE/NonD family hydrolase
MAKQALGYDIPFVNKYLQHMDLDDFWKMTDWKSRIGGHRVPALIMSGWFDDNGMGTTEALDICENYEDKKVILGPWIHSGNSHYDVHGLELGMNALRYDMDMICLDWLDHYLKGVDNGIEKTPKVEYYTMGTNEWKTAANWPVPETKDMILYLDGARADAAVTNEGMISVNAPASEQTDTFLYDPKNPATHIIDMSENEIEVPEDYTEEEKRSDILCYTTETLTEDLTITGDAYAQLYFSSDCEDTDLIVRITDVDENGRSMKLADGMLCVRYRNGFEVPEFMEVGVVYPVKIRTTKLSHTFKAGHKLRITITSSAKNFTFPNSNTRAGFNSVETKIAKNSIHRGGEHASHVVIRVE